MTVVSARSLVAGAVRATLGGAKTAPAAMWRMKKQGGVCGAQRRQTVASLRRRRLACCSSPPSASLGKRTYVARD